VYEEIEEKSYFLSSICWNTRTQACSRK